MRRVLGRHAERGSSDPALARLRIELGRQGHGREFCLEENGVDRIVGVDRGRGERVAMPGEVARSRAGDGRPKANEPKPGSALLVRVCRAPRPDAFARTREAAVRGQRDVWRRLALACGALVNRHQPLVERWGENEGRSG